MRSQHCLSQVAVNRAQGAEAASNPQLNAAGPYGDFTDERRIRSLCRMPHGVHHLAAPGERLGNDAVYRPKANWILDEPPVGAVVADERMHTHRRVRAAARLQQPGKGAHGCQPTPRTERSGRLVNEVGVDPVEQSDVEDEIPVRAGHAAPQTRLDPRGRHVGLPDDVRQCVRPAGVAVYAQRNGPSRRLCGKLRNFPARKLLVEELRDIGPGEAQIVGLDSVYPPVEQQHRNIKACRQCPASHREMQIRRRSADEAIEHGDRLGVSQAFDFVECEQTWRPEALDSADQQVNPVAGAGIGVLCRREIIAGVFVASLRRGGVESGAFEGQ